jgi:hypothetical protein
MPKFKVRLEDGSGEFRLTYLKAEDEDAARAACERMEYERAAYKLTAENREQMEAEEADESVKTSGQTRWALVVDRQEKPYKVKTVEEVS